MKRLLMIGCIGLALALSGCKKDAPPKKDKKEKKEAKKEKKAPLTPVDLPPFAPDEPKTKVEGAATAADFEEEADKTVVYENLEAELDRLEAEIAGG